jgi:D-alanine-D-alanine ligase-like ATP-grasp enzyme
MRNLLAIFLILYGGNLHAREYIESYSHKEFLQLARATVAVVEDMKNDSRNTDINMIMKSTEFTGYVASYLDFAQEGESKEIIRSCVANKSVVEIAVNVAYLLSENEPNRETRHTLDSL